MSKKEGYALYQCDRDNAHQEYVIAGSNAANAWHEITRVDANGVYDTALLCDECYRNYLALVQAQDNQFAMFMTKKDE